MVPAVAQYPLALRPFACFEDVLRSDQLAAPAPPSSSHFCQEPTGLEFELPPIFAMNEAPSTGNGTAQAHVKLLGKGKESDDEEIRLHLDGANAVRRGDLGEGTAFLGG